MQPLVGEHLIKAGLLETKLFIDVLMLLAVSSVLWMFKWALGDISKKEDHLESGPIGKSVLFFGSNYLQCFSW